MSILINLIMINIFATILGCFLFVELVILISLLKPIKEPYYIRDYWCKVQTGTNYEKYFILVSILSLLLTNFLEMFYENYFYSKLLTSTDDKTLNREFYKSNFFISLITFFIPIYLLILIERITLFLITVARLLDFELMCRYAILNEKEDSTFTKTKISMLVKIYKINNMKLQYFVHAQLNSF